MRDFPIRRGNEAWSLARARCDLLAIEAVRSAAGREPALAGFGISGWRKQGDRAPPAITCALARTSATPAQAP